MRCDDALQEPLAGALDFTQRMSRLRVALRADFEWPPPLASASPASRALALSLTRQPSVTAHELETLECVFGTATAKRALARLVFPPPPPEPEPSPEFLARKALLKQRFEQREYARMHVFFTRARARVWPG